MADCDRLLQPVLKEATVWEPGEGDVRAPVPSGSATAAGPRRRRAGTAHNQQQNLSGAADKRPQREYRISWNSVLLDLFFFTSDSSLRRTEELPTVYAQDLAGNAARCFAAKE